MKLCTAAKHLAVWSVGAALSWSQTNTDANRFRQGAQTDEVAHTLVKELADLKAGRIRTADDHIDLGMAYWQAGFLSQAHETFVAIAERFPEGAAEARKYLQTVDAQSSNIEKYLGTIEKALGPIRDRATRSSPELIEGISLTTSLVALYSDVASGRTRLVVKWTENGQQKVGQFMVGQKGEREWNDALNGLGMAFDIPTDEKGFAELLSPRKLSSWPIKLRYITMGMFRGGYIGAVDPDKREALLLIIPGLEFFRQHLR